MTTLEKLFVQIFDRKKWIEDQLKQQRDLYDQYLAATLLTNGIRPPSWLLTSGFQGGSAELKELKKEELISGLLFPPPRPNIASNTGRNTLYRRPFVPESSAHQSGCFTETCASNKYSNVGNKLTLVAKCNISSSENDVGCTLEGVPELDQTIASPEDQTDGRMCDVDFQLEKSLAMIQRSRSRQKAMELRNSSNSKPKKRSIADCTSTSSGRVTRSRTCGEPSQAKELLELENTDTMNESGGKDTHCDRLTMERTSGQATLTKELLELCNFSNTTHGSKSKVSDSRFSAQELNYMEKPGHSFSSAKEKDHHNTLVTKSPVLYSSSRMNQVPQKSTGENAEEHPKGGFMDECCGKGMMSETTHLQIAHSEGLLKLDKSSKVPCGRVTCSRSNSSNKFSLLPNPSNSVEQKNLLKASDAQVVAVPPNEGNGFFLQERCDTTVPDVELVSEVLVADCHDHIGASKACGLGMAKVDLASSPLNEDNAYVEPKKLHFDDVGNCNLNKTYSPSLKKIILARLTEARTTPPEPQEFFREEIVSDLYQSHLSSVDSRFLKKGHNLTPVNEEKNGRASYTHEDESNSVRKEKSYGVFLPAVTGQTSIFSVIASKEETEVYKDIVADSSSETGESRQELLELSEEFSNSDKNRKKGALVDLLEGDQIMEVVNSEKEQRTSLEAYKVEKPESPEKSKCHLSTEQDSHTSPSFPSTEGTSENIKSDSFSGGRKNSEHPTDPSNHLTALQDAKKQPLLRQPDMEGDCSPPDVGMEPDKVTFGEMCNLMLDAKPDKILEKQCKLASDRCRSPEKDSHTSPPLTSTKETCENIKSDRISSGRKTSEHPTDPSNHLTALQHAMKQPLLRQPDMEGDWSLPDVDMEPDEVSFGDMCNSMVDAKPDKILEKKCELTSDGCSSPEKSLSSHPNHVSGVTEFVVATDAAILCVQRQLNNTTQGAPYFFGNNSLNENEGCTSSNRSYFAKKSMHSPEISYDVVENTWPPYKRRKIDSSTISATSSKLTWVEPFHQIDEDSLNIVLEHVRDDSGPDLQFQHIRSSSDVGVSYSKSTCRPDSEMYRSEKRRKTEGYQTGPAFKSKEVDQKYEGEDQHRSIMLGVKEHLMETFLTSNVDAEANGDSQPCIKDQVMLTDTSARQLVIEDHRNSASPRSKLHLLREKQAVSTEETLHCRQPGIRELLVPSVMSIDESLNLNSADHNLPEFEGFSVGVNKLSSPPEDSRVLDKLDLPCRTSERVSILEKLCRSTSFLSQLPHSSMYKSPKAPDKYQSFPTGLLESMYLRNAVLFNDDDIKQLNTSYNLMDVEADPNSCSTSTSSSVQCDWSVRKPPTPPVRRIYTKITAFSGPPSSEKKQSVNPELTCFRIDEDTSTSEGNGNFDEVIDVVQEGSSPRDDISSTYRNPLTNVTNTNQTKSASGSKMFRDKGSLDSVSTELNFHGTNMSGNYDMGKGYAKTRLSKNKDKDNQSSSVVRNGADKSSSLRSRFAESKLSGKASDKKGRFVDKGYKQTNIVSNVSSFVPLVQQKKQQAALITGKRDIKVKSLEAAEVAKRVAEKRENDRKIKKGAAKAARERLEQEKIKQMELRQKNKEEERKKKEANMVVQKRHREEEERKDKEKKRIHILQKGEKMRAVKEQKESQSRAADDRGDKRKELKNENKKHQKTEKGRDIINRWKATETCTWNTDVSAGNASEASDIHAAAEAFKMSADKGESNISGAYDYGFSFIERSGEQSYEISPYQASDDEDEEERDVMPNHKFRPSWAREKALDSVLPSMQQVDPFRIFPPSSFCSVTQILMPRMNLK